MSEIVLTGEEAGNYVLSQPAGEDAEINIVPKVLTIKDIKAEEKVYDGSSIVNLTGGELVGVEETDIARIGFTLPLQGNAENDNVGEHGVIIPQIALTGTAIRNYTLQQPSIEDVKVTITKKDVNVEGVTAVNRQYDASTEVELNRGNLVGVIEQDLSKVDYILPENGIMVNKKEKL